MPSGVGGVHVLVSWGPVVNRRRARRIRYGVVLGRSAAEQAPRVVNPLSFLRLLRPRHPVSRAAYDRAVGLATTIHSRPEGDDRG